MISNSVDIGVAAGAMGVLGAFSKGAPVRILAAETTGAGDLIGMSSGFADQVVAGHGRQDHVIFDQRVRRRTASCWP